MRRFFLKFFLFVLGFIVVERLCHSATEGFRLQKVVSTLSFDPRWETAPPENMAEIDQALNQPFSFLGSGGQCYAFLSQDKKFVLKLFKHHHMRVPCFYLKWIPKLAKTRKERFEHIFGSFKLSYEHLKEETALVYLHLNKTDLFKKNLTLIDKLGIAHKIDLDRTEFALQKTATLAFTHLRHKMKHQDIEGAKESLSSLLQLIVTRSKRGIADRDPILKRNFGFIGNQAVEIDLGSFSKNEDLKKPYVYKRELFYETLKLRKWVKKHYPELLSYLNEAINAHLN